MICSNRIGVALAPDVADDSVRARAIGCELNGWGGAGYEGDTSAPASEQPGERESKAGRPSGDGDAKIFDPGIGWHR